MAYTDPQEPVIRPERRSEKNGLFVVLGIVALVAIVAIGYAVMNSPADIEPAAGIESPMTPSNDNTAGNNAPGTGTDADSATTAPRAGTPGTTY